MNNLLFHLVVFFVPFTRLRALILTTLGHQIAATARVGIIVAADSHLTVAPGARIASFSYFKGVHVTLDEGASIGSFNIFRGTFDVVLRARSHIGRFCQFKNGGAAFIPKRSTFHLGPRSNVTSSHYFDMSSDISIGSGSVIGGRGTACWTHGFLHFNRGATRAINISAITIGDGVYVGGGSAISPGTSIGSDINIGASSSVAGELSKPGLYVSERLRFLPLGTYEEFKSSRRIDEGYKTGNPLIVRDVE